MKGSAVMLAQPGIEGEVAARRGRGDKRHKAVLIDPRPLSRACLSHLLKASAREFTLLSVATPTELLEDHSEGLGDVGLIVLNVGAAPIGKNGTFEGIRLLSRRLPDVPLIVLSDCDEFRSIMEALRHGVRGFIPTSLNPHVAIEAIRLVRAGGTFVPVDALVEALNQGDLEPPPPEAAFDPPREAQPEPTREAQPEPTCQVPLKGFTPRQLEVLALVREGKQNKIIAHELSMQESTVKVHVRHIMRKLKASNRTQAAFLAQRVELMASTT